MTVVVPISKRGTVTLPPAFRQRFGLELENPHVIIEERNGELVLRPAAAAEVRDLPASVIQEWIDEDEKGMREFEALKKQG